MTQEPPPRNHLGLGLWEVGNRRGAETAEGVAGAIHGCCRSSVFPTSEPTWTQHGTPERPQIG